MKIVVYLKRVNPTPRKIEITKEISMNLKDIIVKRYSPFISFCSIDLNSFEESNRIFTSRMSPFMMPYFIVLFLNKSGRFFSIKSPNL